MTGGVRHVTIPIRYWGIGIGISGISGIGRYWYWVVLVLVLVLGIPIPNLTRVSINSSGFSH